VTATHKLLIIMIVRNRTSVANPKIRECYEEFRIDRKEADGAPELKGLVHPKEAVFGIKPWNSRWMMLLTPSAVLICRLREGL
jgi:hypothetical protein